MARSIVVIKIGSNSLVDAAGRLDHAFLREMATQVARVAAGDRHPIVVSSGAVACGAGALGVPIPEQLSERQALAAVGQAGLMHAWQQYLGASGLAAAQILLNDDDFNNRVRYLNLTATLRALFAHRVVPVVNENDSVAVEELALGDNDRLSALVASQLEADWLLLLTDIDGCYDQDPRLHPEARRLAEIIRVDRALLERAGGASGPGKGGMQSKLEAARVAGRAGVTTVIADARVPGVVERLLAGERIGTLVRAAAHARPGGRERWLAFARKSRGTLTVDRGAERALREQGRSLLPVGITAVLGDFARGDTVDICAMDGTPVARGLASLSAAELNRVHGRRMDVAARLLGYALPKAAIHRDNLLLHPRE